MECLRKKSVNVEIFNAIKLNINLEIEEIFISIKPNIILDFFTEEIFTEEFFSEEIFSAIKPNIILDFFTEEIFSEEFFSEEIFSAITPIIIMVFFIVDIFSVVFSIAIPSIHTYVINISAIFS